MDQQASLNMMAGSKRSAPSPAGQGHESPDPLGSLVAAMESQEYGASAEGQPMLDLIHSMHSFMRDSRASGIRIDKDHYLQSEAMRAFIVKLGNARVLPHSMRALTGVMLRLISPSLVPGTNMELGELFNVGRKTIGAFENSVHAHRSTLSDRDNFTIGAAMIVSATPPLPGEASSSHQGGGGSSLDAMAAGDQTAVTTVRVKLKLNVEMQSSGPVVTGTLSLEVSDALMLIDDSATDWSAATCQDDPTADGQAIDKWVFSEPPSQRLKTLGSPLEEIAQLLVNSNSANKETEPEVLRWSSLDPASLLKDTGMDSPASLKRLKPITAFDQEMDDWMDSLADFTRLNGENNENHRQVARLPKLCRPVALRTHQQMWALQHDAQFGSHTLRASFDPHEHVICAHGKELNGLFDNGATTEASCTRTLAGVIPHTHDWSGVGAIGMGSDSAYLESRGSHLFMYIREGKDGTREVVLRRMRHTPDLRLDAVFSEACEVYEHGYEISFDAMHGRILSAPHPNQKYGYRVPLIMSETMLGFLRCHPVDDPVEQGKYLHAMRQLGQASIMYMERVARSVSVHNSEARLNSSGRARLGSHWPRNHNSGYAPALQFANVGSLAAYFAIASPMYQLVISAYERHGTSSFLWSRFVPLQQAAAARLYSPSRLAMFRVLLAYSASYHAMAYNKPVDLAGAYIQMPVPGGSINHFHDIRDD